jgi:hypothetical protein
MLSSKLNIALFAHRGDAGNRVHRSTRGTEVGDEARYHP